MIRKVSALNSALIKDWMMADPTIFILPHACIQGLGLVRAITIREQNENGGGAH